MKSKHGIGSFWILSSQRRSPSEGKNRYKSYWFAKGCKHGNTEHPNKQNAENDLKCMPQFHTLGANRQNYHQVTQQPMWTCTGVLSGTRRVCNISHLSAPKPGIQGVPLKHWEVLYCAREGAMELVAQKLCAVFLLEDLQKTPKHVPWQPVLGSHAWEGDLDQVQPEVSSCLICDSAVWLPVLKAKSGIVHLSNHGSYPHRVH